MSKYKKQCIVYSVIIVCSVCIIAVNIKILFKSISNSLTYDTSMILDETTSKHHPLTTVNTSPTTHKVGDVPEGTVIEHTFTIKNTGSNPLVIYDIIPDCTCTDCSLSHKFIMPNEQTDISVTVDTKGKDGIFIVNVIISANSQEGAHRLKITLCVV